MGHIQSLPELLKVRAEESPQEPFLYFKDQLWTRKDIDSASDTAARQLKLCHIEPGDRVAILLPNCPEFLISLFGIWKLGAVAVPINTQLKPDEILYILKDAGASSVLLGPAHHDLAEPLLAQCHTLKFIQKVAESHSKRDILRFLSPFETKKDIVFEFPADDDPASIIYTSGTTGFPKGAVLSHTNYLFDCDQFVQAIGMTEKDRFLCFLPLFHVNGQVVTTLSPLLCGGSMVLMEKFQPKEFFELLSKHRCTAFSGVPSVYSVLLSLPDAEKYDLSSLRFCICGAAPMPVEVFEKFEAKFKAYILEGYGLSEGTCYSSINPPPPAKRKIGSIGLPAASQPMKIVDDKDRDLADGKVGEIVINGENVMDGYWNNEKATHEAIQGNWLHTGDLGFKDKDGYFFIVGRKKEMIIRGGENIYPKEIEEVLYKNPAVAEAAVVGLPDKRWGEEVAAFIVLKEDRSCSAKEITAYLKEKIADYKIPRTIEFVKSLPKTATGKIQKTKLRDEYLKGRHAAAS